MMQVEAVQLGEIEGRDGKAWDGSTSAGHHQSRRPQGAEQWDSIREILRDLEIETLDASPSESESLAQLVLRHQGDVDLVVLGGGDGTLNAAVEGLVEAQLPVGIIPLGTANDLARTLALPTDLAQACRVIASGRTRRIDLGQVNGKYFFNVASILLSAGPCPNISGFLSGRSCGAVVTGGYAEQLEDAAMDGGEFGGEDFELVVA
jgi:hypothetical protein